MDYFQIRLEGIEKKIENLRLTALRNSDPMASLPMWEEIDALNKERNLILDYFAGNTGRKRKRTKKCKS